MKQSKMTVWRLSWEGNSTLNNSQAYIKSLAQAFQADGTGLMVLVSMNISTKDIATGVTFTTEQAAYDYAKASSLSMATDLIPYMSNVLGLSCGNELTDNSKDGIRSPAAVMGTNDSDFSNAKFPMLRGVMRGCEAGIRQANAGFKVGTNAFVFAETAVIAMLLEGRQPDGTTGHGVITPDYIDLHCYHSWGNIFKITMDGAGWAPHFNFVRWCFDRGFNVIISETNGDAPSQTDADMKAFMDAIYYEAFKSRFDCGLICVCYYNMWNTDYAWGMRSSTSPYPPVQNRGQSVINFARMFPDDIDGSKFDPVRAAAMDVILSKPPGSFHLYLPAENAFPTTDCVTQSAVSSAVIALQDMAGYPELFFWQTTNPPGLTADGQAIQFNTASFLTMAGTGAMPTVAADHAFIAGFKPSGTARAMSVFAPGTVSQASKYSRAGSIEMTATQIKAIWTSDAPADSIAAFTLTDAWTNSRVVTSRKVGSNGSLRINGLVKATAALTTWTAATLNTGYFGRAYGDDPNYFTGLLYALLSCIVSLTDLELLILERWINQISKTGVVF